MSKIKEKYKILELWLLYKLFNEEFDKYKNKWYIVKMKYYEFTLFNKKFLSNFFNFAKDINLIKNFNIKWDKFLIEI